MSERPLRDPLPRDLTDSQRQAANPETSIWVEANAGSGKTRVLTDRVLRLLLSGVRPDEILCLTYTKAAAAEMRDRVGKRLALWALATPDKLETELFELRGTAPDAAELNRARTLFAHALETPGGLKIQTIHAFAESVLHRFPVEAGVPFDFGVIEDEEKTALIIEVRDAVLARGLAGENGESRAVEVLFDAISDSTLNDSIAAALADMTRLKAVLGDLPAANAALRAFVGINETLTREAVEAEITGKTLLGPEDLRTVIEWRDAKGKPVGFARYVEKHDYLNPSAQALLAICLTGDGDARKKPFNKDFEADVPEVGARILAEIARVHALSVTLLRVGVVERSTALMQLLDRIVRRYEAEKAARARLDFEDLIAALSRLLANPARGDWVRYKLDGGITHILIDEGQDTNPEQWKLIRPLAEEILGTGGIERPRSLFAVGDGKQSIYSFQGADPAIFRTQRDDLQALAARNKRRFERVRLTTSFRTLSSVLYAVDLVFRDETRRNAVLEETAVEHRTARRHEGGHVTLWPAMAQPAGASETAEWPLTVPDGQQSPPRELAARIARTIREWVDSARPLEHRGRAVSPDDVLVLVQTRSVLFHEIIRALRAEGLTTPGADRLQVTGHIAVRDLLALGDVLLNPADDLQLAALLRSPLFDISEDQLFTLAYDRAQGEHLWHRLETATFPEAQAAWTTLHGWRSRLDFERPYEFFADVLYRDGGLRRFHQRLGADVDDVLSEFLALALDHEARPAPALQAFLAEMRHREVVIKRELSERGAGVRVMTVHGAKGLEAPIVILADATAVPSGKQLNKPVYLSEAGDFLVHAPSAAVHSLETLKLRDALRARQMEEYWRKLYVAMTRAEDELYVTGVLPKKGADAPSWYNVVSATLAEHTLEVEQPDGTVHRVFRVEGSAPVAPATAKPPPEGLEERAASLPPKPVPPPVRREILRPSMVEDDDPLTLFDTAAQSVESARGAERARAEGTAIHALLQHLPGIPAERQEEVALKALAVLLPEAPEHHAALAAKALSIIRQPALAELFGPHARAELPFLLDLQRAGGAPIRVAGRIDRLVARPDGSVLIVDFKSDARPVARPEDVNPSYIRQLGLYALCATQLFPGARIEAAILWTALESLLELPPATLRDAVRQFTFG